jgi:hypothetical protein
MSGNRLPITPPAIAYPKLGPNANPSTKKEIEQAMISPINICESIFMINNSNLVYNCVSDCFSVQSCNQL